MNTVVQVKDKKFALYISEEKIKARVKEVAAQIDEDLRKKNPLFLVILNGSFIFAADLLRDINFPCEITFVKMSSYEGTSTTGLPLPEPPPPVCLYFLPRLPPSD